MIIGVSCLESIQTFFQSKVKEKLSTHVIITYILFMDTYNQITNHLKNQHRLI